MANNIRAYVRKRPAALFIVLVVLGILAWLGAIYIQDRLLQAQPQEYIDGDPVYVRVTPARSLREILGLMEGQITVYRLTIIEGGDRELAFQLAPPTSDPVEVLAQYEAAYVANYSLLRQLLSTGLQSASADARAATEAELDRLAKMADSVRDPDTIAVAGIEISGPALQLDIFQAAIRN